MSTQGQRMVDGRGIERVLLEMVTSFKANQLTVRRARFQDAKLLWKWANDLGVRSNSFHSEMITLEDHFTWFKQKLDSADTKIWIVEQNQTPIGQIRYDRVAKDTAEIGFSVASEHRGRGLGTKILELTVNMGCQELDVKRLKGIVISSNTASMSSFTSAGFVCTGQTTLMEKACQILILECAKTTGKTHGDQPH